MQNVSDAAVQNPFNSFYSGKQNQVQNNRPLKNPPVVKDTFEKKEVKEQDSVTNKSKITEEKKKKDLIQKISSVAGILASIAFIGYFLSLFAPSLARKKMPNNIFTDLQKEKGLKNLNLPESLVQTTKEIINQIKSSGEIFERGGKGSRSILLYGPPGTGKTTYAQAITKEFPNAKFVSVDLGRMKSKWVGETEQNVNDIFDKICAYADTKHSDYNQKLAQIIGEDIVKTGDIQKIQAAIRKAQQEGKQIPDQEQIFVFIDEIDSVMMVDKGNGAKLSNDVLNVFKKAFTEKLSKRDNIITIGATNLEIDAGKAALLDGKMLDKPMLDRFSQKIRVPNPDKNQIKATIMNNYQNAALVEQELKTDNGALDELSAFLAKEEHNLSFRKLINIFNKTANRTTGSKQKVSIQDIKQTLKEMQEELNINPDDVDKICKKD